MDTTSPRYVILYDGVCGLCNRLNQFVIRRDRANKFHFASLQSSTAHKILRRHGRNPEDLDSLYLVQEYDQPDELLSKRSLAVVAILSELGLTWKVLAKVMRIIPSPIREFGYRLVARNRYKTFGKYEVCPMPTKEFRSKFLDI